MRNIKGYRGPTYYGYPYLERAEWPDGHPLDAQPIDEDLTRSTPRRTKQSDPYGYDPFTIWGEPAPDKSCNGSDYTDRLHAHDHVKYDQLAKKHYQSGECNFARPFSEHGCKGPLIEAFLRDWHDDPALKLLRVVEYCNSWSGYQTFRLDYHSSKVKP